MVRSMVRSIDLYVVFPRAERKNDIQKKKSTAVQDKYGTAYACH